ncbi:hypothetical protein HPB51_014078 [Rhipicephalus microplus]|uniref:Uncharacterized protein n=1 Tax=Rhipicephalus microplus TaxID=6941 RepID=A0A9J6EA84_RHIMP|nr:hypothetical protein HPB51_014078 [Rhipicephalus microplus]
MLTIRCCVNGNEGGRAEPAYIPVTHENDVAVQQRETPSGCNWPCRCSEGRLERDDGSVLAATLYMSIKGEKSQTEAVGQQWQNEAWGGYRPVMARNLSRLVMNHIFRKMTTSGDARRRWCSWSRSRPAGESASTWVAESGKLRRAGPIYRVFSGVAEQGSDQPPHSEQLSQRRPWCDGNFGTFPNPRDAATRRTISTTVAWVVDEEWCAN